jgi:hypothetical protein
MNLMKKLGQSIQSGLGNTLKSAKKYGNRADKLSGKIFRTADRYTNKADRLLNSANDFVGFDIADKATGGLLNSDKLIGSARYGIEKGKKYRKKIKKDYDTLDAQFGTKKDAKQTAKDIAKAIQKGGFQGGLKDYAKDNYRLARR